MLSDFEAKCAGRQVLPADRRGPDCVTDYGFVREVTAECADLKAAIRGRQGRGGVEQRICRSQRLGAVAVSVEVRRSNDTLLTPEGQLLQRPEPDREKRLEPHVDGVVRHVRKGSSPQILPSADSARTRAGEAGPRGVGGAEVREPVVEPRR